MLSINSIAEIIEPNIFVKEQELDEHYIFSDPIDFIIDKDFNLFILDCRGNELSKYDISGKYIKNIGRKGNGPGEFSRPRNLDLLDSNNLLVSFRGGTRYNIYSINGNFISAKDMIWDFLFLPRDEKYYSAKCCVRLLNIHTEHRTALLYYGNIPSRSKEIISHDDTPYLKPYVSPIFYEWYRRYIFDYTLRGDVLWCTNEEFKIWKYISAENKSVIFINEKIDPLKLSDAEYRMRKKEISGSHPVGNKDFSRYYEVITSITVDDKDNIWVGTINNKQKGFRKYSPSGKFLQFYEIKGQFRNPYATADVPLLLFWNTKIIVRGDYIFFFTVDEEGLKIYRAVIPK